MPSTTIPRQSINWATSLVRWSSGSGPAIWVGDTGSEAVKDGAAVLYPPWERRRVDITMITASHIHWPATCQLHPRMPPAAWCSCGYYMVTNLPDLIRWIQQADDELVASSPLVIGRVMSLGRVAPAPADNGDLPTTFRATSYAIVGPLHLSPPLSSPELARRFEATFGCAASPSGTAGNVQEWLRDLPASLADPDAVDPAIAAMAPRPWSNPQARKISRGSR